MQLEEIVRKQEAEVPAVLPLEKYKSLFSESEWTEGEKLAKSLTKSKKKLATRLARWLLLNLDWIYTQVILDREGRVQWMRCTCGAPAYCKHEAALLHLWATNPNRFAVLQSPRLTASLFYTYRNEPLHEKQPAPPSIEEIIEPLARILEEDFRLPELRAMAKTWGLKHKARKKTELALLIARTMFSEQIMAPLIERLSPAAKVAFLLHVAIDKSVAQRIWEDEQTVDHVISQIYAFFVPDVPYESAWDEIVEMNLHPYTRSLIAAWRVVPWLSKVLQLPLRPTSPPSHPRPSRSPWELVYDLYEFLEEVGNKGYTMTPLDVPQTIDKDLVMRHPDLWHPEWAVLPSRLSIYPMFFHTLRLTPTSQKRLTRRRGFSEEGGRLVFLLSNDLGLISIEQNTLVLSKEHWASFVVLPRLIQMKLVFESAFWNLARMALDRLQAERGYRFVSPIRRWTWAFGSFTLSFWLQAVMAVLNGLLAFAPEGEWLPWEEVERIIAPFQTEEMAKQFRLTFAVDPIQEWPEVLQAWWHEFFRLLPYTGLVELATEGRKITHVRFLHLHNALLFLRDVPFPVPDTHTLSPAEVKVRTKNGDLIIHLPPTTPEPLMSLLTSWGGKVSLHSGRLSVFFSPAQISKLVQSGQTAADAAAAWEKVSGFPMPKPILSLWEMFEKNRGQALIYPQVLILRFQDPVIRRHIELALPEIRPYILGQLDERTLILHRDAAKSVRSALERAGYPPKWIDLEDVR